MSNSRVSTWSGIRNKLENDYLCPALRGHIQYFAASYRESHDQTGRAAIWLNDGCFDNVFSMRHFTNLTTRASRKALPARIPLFFLRLGKNVGMMQGQGNMRIIELLRYFYEQTDENHPATVSDMISYLNGKEI